MRGDIKVIINEIQDGIDAYTNTFRVKLQSNLLKKYTREEPGEVPLTDIVEAMKDFLEAAEEINGKLNLLTAELPPKELPKLAKMKEAEMDNLHRAPPSPMQPIHGTLSASIHGTKNPHRTLTPKTQYPHSNFVSKVTRAGISVGDGSNGKLTSQMSPSSDKSGGGAPGKAFMFIPGGSPYSGAQPKNALVDAALPNPPAVGVRTEAFWETGGFGVGIPVLSPTKKAPQGASPAAKSILLKHDKFEFKQSNEPKLVPTVTTAYINSATANRVPIAESRRDSLPPHLRPVVKSASSASTAATFNSLPSSGNHSFVGELSPSIDFSDRFFDLLDSATDDGAGPSSGVLKPRKLATAKSGKMKIDFFGSVGSLKESDAGDLMSWNSERDAFAYVHENDSLDMEVGEGVSLLLD